METRISVISMADKDDVQNVKTLKYVIGTQGREIHDTFTFDKKEEIGHFQHMPSTNWTHPQ